MDRGSGKPLIPAISISSTGPRIGVSDRLWYPKSVHLLLGVRSAQTLLENLRMDGQDSLSNIAPLSR